MTTKREILSSLKSNKSKINRLGITDIGLFGSYVRNERTRDSDIDILVAFDPERETFDNLMEVYALLENIFKETRVEIVTKNGLSPYIGPRILNEVIYV